MKILIVLTSNDQLGDTDRKTGFWLEEFTAPYYAFKDAVFYPGGHGLLWDLVEDQDSIKLIETFYATGKPIGAICHAPAVFRHPRKPNGEPLVEGLNVTGFSNSEETAVQLMDVVPFSVEDMLNARGGLYAKGDDWDSFVQTDGQLITGQNPGSSAATAQALLEKMPCALLAI
jgi:putative intracellular protease/amidase